MAQSQLDVAISNFADYIEARYERVNKDNITQDITNNGIVLEYEGVYKTYTTKMDTNSKNLISSVDVKVDTSKIPFEPDDND